ncbi:hypothetical protein E2C01_090218 [Portunus trituberculatus]|uniref:Uncharacterized protein n=1 Tax=Portunus trituberculatus TaxID=210409 RepID=A0A5B7JL91_PORTR|nr:hypothetical protein [Portunus trituberculatus]
MCSELQQERKGTGKKGAAANACATQTTTTPPPQVTALTVLMLFTSRLSPETCCCCVSAVCLPHLSLSCVFVACLCSHLVQRCFQYKNSHPSIYLT